MRIYVNEKPVNVAVNTVAELLAVLNELPEYFSLAVNDELVEKKDYAGTRLQENDRVTIFSFMAGG
ncbi:MAG: sulfur carrier protein ThiS [Ruminobacter sp.]|nr:sulfur carrier protein ThiS [Ruminobacter sp.]